jgi:hypothetical protein
MILALECRWLCERDKSRHTSHWVAGLSVFPSSSSAWTYVTWNLVTYHCYRGTVPFVSVPRGQSLLGGFSAGGDGAVGSERCLHSRPTTQPKLACDQKHAGKTWHSDWMCGTSTISKPPLSSVFCFCFIVFLFLVRATQDKMVIIPPVCAVLHSNSNRLHCMSSITFW